MRNLLILSLALNIFVLGGLGLAYGFPGTRNVQAQESTDPKVPSAPASKEVSAAHLVRLAGDLAQWGRDNKHAGAIAVASAILSGTEVKTSKALDEKMKEAKEGAIEAIGSEVLLKEAKEMAGPSGAPFMEALTKMGMTGRGLARGAVKATAACNPSGKNDKGEVAPGIVKEKLQFVKGEYAAIWVGGDGSTDLDLYVFDKNGKTVVCDMRPGDSCWVEWVPEDTEYTILIVNWGNKKNPFTIVLN